MQCPKCGHEPTLKEVQASPDDCPQCGVNYTKFQQIKEREAEEAAQQRAVAASLKKVSPVVRTVMHDYPGAQPVVVIDLNMGFWSMVKFMVKWAFASIPALLIIFGIGLALSVLWSALMGFPGFGRVPVSVDPHASAGEPKDPLYIDIPSEPDVAFFLLNSIKNGSGKVAMELKRNAPTGVTYQSLGIDCTARTISTDADATSYADMLATRRSGVKRRPNIGTTEDFLISRACR
ncbi:hypothetical protein [Pseudomonas nitroreducens]|uniref:hypothetical protein n=1 Tax=Pseudomonas nitroreducens TaxID=46680 RepID=UPI003D2A8887